ncbi:hypothetical protein CsatB_025755 [Cannabis sativa]
MMVVLVGWELVGEDELSLVEALKHGKVNKPVVAWRDKNEALREAGAVVPTSFEDFEAVINETFDKLVKSHVMLVFLYFLLLSKAMVLVTLFLCYGSNTAFYGASVLIIAHNSILTESHEFVEGMKKKGISSARNRAQVWRFRRL